MVKIDVDAIICLDLNKVGIGVIVRDYESVFLARKTSTLAAGFDSFQAELLAAREGHLFVW